MEDVHFDHHNPGFVGSRLHVYDDLRSRCPVAHSDVHGGFWVLTGYEEVFAVARDDRTFSSRGSGLIPPGDDVGFLPPIQTDPPDVERFRALLGPYLLPREVAKLEPTILSDVHDSIERFRATGRIEIVDEVACPVPARATMRLLGLDPREWKTFSKPLHDASRAEPGSEEDQDARRRVLAFTEVISAEVDARYGEPTDDGLISGLIAGKKGPAATRQDVIDLTRMVIFGGMDTVTAAIGNIFAILAVRGDLRRRLADDPHLIPKAVEEFLRYEAPIQGFSRTVNWDTSIAGTAIRAGEKVWLAWGSANHDPGAFDDPATIEIQRTPNRHMTFGIGAHRCLGSTLTRTQLRVILDAFLSATPDFELVDPGVVQQRTIGQILGKSEVHLALIG